MFAAIFWLSYSNSLQENSLEIGGVSTQDYPGALSIYEGIVPTDGVDLLPSPVNAPSDTARFYYDSDCFTSIRESTPKVCSYGNTENPEFTIALVGGSHSGHWFTALEEVAKNLNIQLDTYIRDGCRFSSNDFNGLLKEQCMKWNEEVTKLLLAKKPDIIFTTATVFGGKDIPEGYKEKWRKFEGTSMIFAVRDNPRMLEIIPSCVETKGIEECSVPTNDILSSDFNLNDPDLPPNVYIADLSQYFCDEETCKPVIGNIIVYRDEHHITASYSKTLAKPLEEHIVKVIKSLRY